MRESRVSVFRLMTFGRDSNFLFFSFFIAKKCQYVICDVTKWN